MTDGRLLTLGALGALALVKAARGSRGVVRRGKGDDFMTRFNKRGGRAWEPFTKRTEDPKLAYLESRLDDLGIPHRRNGSSFHGPILEVPEDALDLANGILSEKKSPRSKKTLDDVDDDDLMFDGFVHEDNEHDRAVLAQRNRT